MTIEEKMEHFKNVSLENASTQSAGILVEYKKSLDEQLEKHKKTATEAAKELEDTKLAAVRLEAKRQLSKLQSDIRREVTIHQNNLKSEVFVAVNDKLLEYKKSAEYLTSLIEQIQKIQKDFSDTEIEFYIDSSDEELMPSLIKATNADIHISQISFVGGIKAIINSQNILVDNSFKTKLSEAQEKFTISI